jgi:two-component system, response regulator YesN
VYKIMLVDDTDIFRRQFKRLMEFKVRNFFTIVYEARNGKEAVDIAKKSAVDVIITDIRMPVMNGIELLQEIKKLHLCTYVVLLSEFADFSSARQGIVFGAFDFIEKPVDGTKLAALFERLKNSIEEKKPADTDCMQNIPAGIVSQNIMIRNICRYIQDNAGTAVVSLDSVSDQFFVNKSYLSHLFKNEMGKNFVDYVTEIKIEKAKTLLKERRLKIYEIAHDLGYEDEEYFSRVFKKIEGINASEYQKQV